jgi:SHS2 domain-containing protein
MKDRDSSMDDETAYFEHGADIGVIGRGASPEAAFVEAARAMFAVMAQPGELDESLSVEIGFEESDVEFALVTWLNRLLAEARLHGAVFRRFELTRDGAHYRGQAFGCKWNPAIARGTEVKGATLTALSVKQDEAGWEARCIVDV